MFITTRYDDNLDSCRIALSLIPTTPDGKFTMLSILDDDQIDIPVRKAAFALASGMMGIKPLPIPQTRILPLYKDGTQEATRAILSRDGNDQNRAVAKRFKDEVVARLPIFPLNKKALSEMKDTITSIFGTEAGSMSSWVGYLETHTSAQGSILDLTKRQPTASRNYYHIHAAPVKQTLIADNAYDAPSPEDINEVNQVAAECISRARRDAKWLSTPSTRCMVLLLVMTVRNAIREGASWPSRQELVSRLQSVKKLLEESVM